MANYIVSYDLNGSRPTHAEMDKHMATVGWARGRILETVWYVGASESLDDVYAHVDSILSANDRLFVVEGKDAAWRNLLVSDDSLTSEWTENR